VSALPWFPWYPGDFAGDAKVRLMSPLARMVYRELIDLSWDLGPIPDPIRAIEATGIVAHSNQTADRIWSDIEPCWQQNGSGWVNVRLERHRATAAHKSEQARAAVEERERRKNSGTAPAERAISVRSSSDDLRASGSFSSGSESSGRKGRSDPRPSRAQAVALAAAHPVLGNISQFPEAVGAWWDGLDAARPKRKVWASEKALALHLNRLANKPDEALRIVEEAGANAWTSPKHLLEPEKGTQHGNRSFVGRYIPPAED